MFEEIDHTADYAIRVRGRDLSELFIEAARGMYALTGANPTQPHADRQVTLEAPDLETLLVTWLEELSLWLETEGAMVHVFTQVTLAPNSLTARLVISPANGIEKLIKAVTFHNLAIRPIAGGYETSIVFDV